MQCASERPGYQRRLRERVSRRCDRRGSDRRSQRPQQAPTRWPAATTATVPAAAPAGPSGPQPRRHGPNAPLRRPTNTKTAGTRYPVRPGNLQSAKTHQSTRPRAGLKAGLIAVLAVVACCVPVAASSLLLDRDDDRNADLTTTHQEATTPSLAATLSPTHMPIATLKRR